MELKLNSVTDFLNEQTWFQELKGKWEELDPQSRTYLKFTGVIVAILVVLYLLLSSVWSVHSLKSELSQKTDLLSMIDNANTEMHQFQASGSPSASAQQSGNWKNYLQTMAANAGIEKSSLTINAGKQPSGGGVAEESMYTLSIKHTTIRQVVKFSYLLENGARPVRLRQLSVDTHGDTTGYLDASLAVSGFSLKGGRTE